MGATWLKQLLSTPAGCFVLPLNTCSLKQLKHREEVASEALQGQEVRNSVFADDRS